MRKILKSLFILAILMFIFTCLPALVHAQTGPSDPNCDPLDPGCPIDGGLIILLAAGVIYGTKKVWDARKRQIPTSLA